MELKRMRRNIRTLAAAIAVTSALALPGMSAAAATAAEAAPAAEPEWTPLAPASEPDVNPLKGFIPFAGEFDTFPHSMEWSYFPLNAVMTGPNTFDWTALDTALDEVAARGHQTAMRFYLDYPTRPSGIPQYLIDGGLVTHPYDDFGNNGVSVSPDYDDPALRAGIGSFVRALGDRYDGDARIGFLQAGLVGFWGEWHTWPHNGDPGTENWMPSETTQAEILGDFVSAFQVTQLEVRNPNAQNVGLPIGYHDDSFALETKQSSLGWHFMDNMVAAGAQDKWKEYSIGGELRPELQSCLFSAAGCPVLEEGGDNDFAGSVAQTHISWMMNHYAFATGYSAADKPAALAASRSIGYSFRATAAQLPAQATPGPLTVGLDIANIGVAPFYYDWPVTLGLVDATGAVVHTQTTDWMVSDIASGSSERFAATVDTSSLPVGDYRVVAQVTNPLSTGLPIRFANATQDVDEDGWLTLGTTAVTAAVVASPSPSASAPAPAADPSATPLPAASVRAGALAETGPDSFAVALAAGLAFALIGAGVIARGGRTRQRQRQRG
jgi:hypothetical protein